MEGPVRLLPAKRELAMNASQHSAVIVSTTADSKSLLEQIADELVSEKLAACCQISGPVTSIYAWEGRVDRSEEYVCSIKTIATLVKQVEATIRQRHSYKEPEIVVTAIVGGSESYLKWIIESLEPPSAGH